MRAPLLLAALLLAGCAERAPAAPEPPAPVEEGLRFVDEFEVNAVGAEGPALDDCVRFTTRTPTRLASGSVRAAWAPADGGAERLRVEFRAGNDTTAGEGPSPLVVRLPATDVPAGGDFAFVALVPEDRDVTVVRQPVSLRVEFTYLQVEDVDGDVETTRCGPRP